MQENDLRQLDILVTQSLSYFFTFVVRQDCYPIQLLDGSYRTIYEPLTQNLLEQHIYGEITLGAYALDTESIARWLCLDADSDSQWEKLWQAAKKLENEGIQPYLEPSRRGGHLWLFTPPLSGKDIRQFGLQLMKAHSLECELYPKQEVLTTGVGSLVRLPLGIHRKSGKRYHFITTKGEALAPSIREQMAILANPHRVSPVYIQQVLSQIESPPPAPQTSFQKIAYAKGETVSERIKNAVSVFEFVSRFVDLDNHGRGLCPFHEDKHQSFQVHAERNFWYCYAGCGGGSIIDFWMKWRERQGADASFKASIKELADILYPISS